MDLDMNFKFNLNFNLYCTIWKYMGNIVDILDIANLY